MFQSQLDSSTKYYRLKADTLNGQVAETVRQKAKGFDLATGTKVVWSGFESVTDRFSWEVEHYKFYGRLA
jgi:hypothetical protein